MGFRKSRFTTPKGRVADYTFDKRLNPGEPHGRSRDYKYPDRIDETIKVKPVTPFHRKESKLSESKKVKPKKYWRGPSKETQEKRKFLRETSALSVKDKSHKRIKPEKYSIVRVNPDNPNLYRKVVVKSISGLDRALGIAKERTEMAAKLKIPGKMYKYITKKIGGKGGVLGLGTALVTAGMAAKKAYDENENKQ